ncbi:MAG: hypothetical protein P8Y10_13575 [Gemmatimonadales bacterium]
MSRRRFVRSGLAAVAASMLPSCSPSTGPGGSNGLTGPRLTARPGSPTLAPTPGLSSLGLGAPRDGLLYVPASYSEDTPAPLFIAFHGAGGAASNWGSYYERAEERGMVFLAIDSRSSTWDLIVYGGFGPDVTFLDEALEHTFERCRIDPAKIAMAGFSDGASYALSLGVSNGDLLSHLIGYSPGFHAPSDPIVGKPRVYISHGTQDAILPVSISRDDIVPSLQDADYDVTYEEFAGGHEVPAEISESALDWFLGAL